MINPEKETSLSSNRINKVGKRVKLVLDGKSGSQERSLAFSRSSECQRAGLEEVGFGRADGYSKPMMHTGSLREDELLPKKGIYQ